MKYIAATMMLSVSVSAWGAVTVYEFDSPQQEAQYQALINDFRCPTCQNQNLAGSDAPIAQDLKQKTYEMVKEGRSDKEIRDFMFERYGDFISYTPPVRPSTWILWFLPPILLVIFVLGWLYKNRRPVLMHDKSTLDSHEKLTQEEEKRLNAIISQFDGVEQTGAKSSENVP